MNRPAKVVRAFEVAISARVRGVRIKPNNRIVASSANGSSLVICRMPFRNRFPDVLSVNELILLYWINAPSYSVKNGRPTRSGADGATAQFFRGGFCRVLDPYRAFAIQAGAVPADATKRSHPQVRKQFNVCSLAVQNGTGEKSLAESLGSPECVGRQLLRLHRQILDSRTRNKLHVFNLELSTLDLGQPEFI